MHIVDSMRDTFQPNIIHSRGAASSSFGAVIADYQQETQRLLCCGTKLGKAGIGIDEGALQFVIQEKNNCT